MRLKADDIIQTCHGIILTQLDNRIRCRSIRTLQSNRLHRPKQQRLPSAACHFLKRHTAFKVGFILKLVQLCGFRMNQLLVKGIKFLPAHRTVDIGSLSLIITGFDICLRKINAVLFNDRGGRIIEMEIIRMGVFLYGFA